MADNLREHPPQRDIAGDAAQEKANQAPEEISNQARGHKANLSNPSKSALATSRARSWEDFC
jgi:hypothetical protein